LSSGVCPPNARSDETKKMISTSRPPRGRTNAPPIARAITAAPT
jgi:hypothetical protein